MDNEVLEVLKDIREEAKQTNQRLDRTIVRLESLEGRVDFLEKRTSKGFERLEEKLEAFGTHLAHTEAMLTTGVRSITAYLHNVQNLVTQTGVDHAMVLDHEMRIAKLESGNPDRESK
jgi:uncharacterized membrane protein YccC